MANDTNPTEEAGPVAGADVNHNIYLGFTIVLFFIGLFGNLLIIMAYILYKKLRSHATTFVVNTAVSDICVGVLGDVFIIAGIATKGEFLEGPENVTICNFSSFLCASVCIVSVWSIAAASFNGYVRVCHTPYYNKIFNNVTMPIMIIGLWAIGVLILLPTLFGWGSHYYDPVLMFCIPSSTYSVSYTYFMVFLGWGIPLVVILYSFGRIIWTVRHSSKIMKRHSTRNTKTSKGSVKDKAAGKSKKPRADMALIRSVAIIAFYFFFAYGFLLIILLMGDNYLGGAPSVVFAVVLAHTHCTFSGILFAGTNKRFRDAYGNMFCCISEKEAESHSSTGTSFSSRLSRLSRFSSKQSQQSLVPSVSGNIESESKT